MKELGFFLSPILSATIIYRKQTIKKLTFIDVGQLNTDWDRWWLNADYYYAQKRPRGGNEDVAERMLRNGRGLSAQRRHDTEWR